MLIQLGQLSYMWLNLPRKSVVGLLTRTLSVLMKKREKRNAHEGQNSILKIFTQNFI